MKNEFLNYYNLPRKAQTHKGVYGKVFVIAGCEGMTGAAMMCAEAAVRSGAGLVYLFSPGKILPVYEMSCRETVKIKIGNDSDSYFKEEHVRDVVKVLLAAENNSAVVIGPGLGRNSETALFVRGVLDEIKEKNIPVILDADGLNAYKGREIPEGMILTPHVAELSRITGYKIKYIEENRTEAAVCASKNFKSVMVLKGNGTIVTSENEIYINETGNPGMATGGSGDVLAGIIAGIVATSFAEENPKSIFELVCIGVYIHGLCGDIGSKRFGERALCAGDLIEMLKEVHLYES